MGVGHLSLIEELGGDVLHVLRRMTEPMRPGLGTLAVLPFLTNWNDLIWQVYVLFSPSKALCRLACRAYTIDCPVVMAGAVVRASR